MNQSDYFSRVLIAVGIVAFAVVSLTALFFVIDVVLLFFAGLLLSVFLRTGGNWISRVTGLPVKVSILVFLSLLIAALVLGLRMFIPFVFNQVHDIAVSLPQTFNDMMKHVQANESLRFLQSHASFDADAVGNLLLGKTAPFVSSILGGLGGSVIVLITGIFFSVDQARVRRGFLDLVPAGRKAEVEEVLAEIDTKLSWWLLARLVSMLTVAALTTVGLLLLHIPSAFGLGVIAGLLSFIPNLGPILSVVPAVGVAYTLGWNAVWQVLVLFAAVQVVETYLITPLVERRALSLSPLLIIFGQITSGLLFGLLGLLLATPLLVSLVILVRRFYIQKR